MVHLVGRRAAILSYRLGMADGVSVTAAQWATALRRLGLHVTTMAGAGRADVLVEGLAVDAVRAPSRAQLADALDDVDLVVVDNVCSLPMNPRVGEAVAEYLAGRPAVLRHHDLPWEREQYAGLTSWPPDDPQWRHVTINEQARRALAERRGIAATTVHHGFDERPCPWRRAQVRAELGVPTGRPLVLQPTRAIARKNVDAGLALAAAVSGTFWLTGPAEDGFAAEVDRMVAAAKIPVRRGVAGRGLDGRRLRGVRRGRPAVVVGGLRPAVGRVGVAPPPDRGRRLPGGPRARGVRFPLVHLGRSRAASDAGWPTPTPTCSTTTRRWPGGTSASTRSCAGSTSSCRAVRGPRGVRRIGRLHRRRVHRQGPRHDRAHRLHHPASRLRPAQTPRQGCDHQDGMWRPRRRLPVPSEPRTWEVVVPIVGGIDIHRAHRGAGRRRADSREVVGVQVEDEVGAQPVLFGHGPAVGELVVRGGIDEM